MTKINRQKQYYILIDESGTLPDSKDEFIIIAGIATDVIKNANVLVSRALESLRQRKVKIKEVKFYYAGDQTKRQILSGIVSEGLGVFLIAIDKKGRKVSDNPENFALLVGELIKEINLWQQEKELKIFIDRHFSKRRDENDFNKYLHNQLTSKNLNYTIQHVESQRNFVINLADFVAGAALAKYNRNNLKFYDIIKEHILFEKIISWPELKRKSLGK
ncbi:MAG: DUF3800 domain-containing protein [Candidatus Nealsonbacteria bacterium]